MGSRQAAQIELEVQVGKQVGRQGGGQVSWQAGTLMRPELACQPVTPNCPNAPDSLIRPIHALLSSAWRHAGRVGSGSHHRPSRRALPRAGPCTAALLHGQACLIGLVFAPDKAWWMLQGDCNPQQAQQPEQEQRALSTAQAAAAQGAQAGIQLGPGAVQFSGPHPLPGACAAWRPCWLSRQATAPGSLRLRRRSLPGQQHDGQHRRRGLQEAQHVGAGVRILPGQRGAQGRGQKKCWCA